MYFVGLVVVVVVGVVSTSIGKAFIAVLNHLVVTHGAEATQYTTIINRRDCGSGRNVVFRSKFAIS